MNRYAFLVVTLVIWFISGCGSNVGYVVKPVRIDEDFREMVISTDRGLFVSDKIVIIDIDGLLLNSRNKGLLGIRENPVSVFVEKIDKAHRDLNVKAVVLRINSPGGGVTACDIMYNRLMQFRTERKLPIVAILEDVGASGAYYLACASDEILAHPTSVIGSIGVMVQTISLAGTMKLLRIDAKAVTSGPRKDMASPFKPLETEDLAILQGMVDEFYSRFLKVVTAARTKLNDQEIRKLADGRVFTGTQALANGLIDGVGYLDEAVTLAKQKAGITRAKIVMYHRPWGRKPNFYAGGNIPTVAGNTTQINLLNVSGDGLFELTQPRFLYLWTGQSFGDQ